MSIQDCNVGYAPPVHMVKLPAAQEITPYKWGSGGGAVTGLNQWAAKALSGMTHRPAIGPMSVQPVDHGSETAAQSQLMPTSASNPSQINHSPRAEAMRTAMAKIRRRQSLKKQRQSQKASAAGMQPEEERCLARWFTPGPSQRKPL
jgi:hypothetical protein